MFNKQNVLLAVIGIIGAFFFSCTTNMASPFTDPGNAKASLYIVGSNQLVSTGTEVIDTVGKTLKVGVCPYLYNLVDSIYVTIAKDAGNPDTIFKPKNFTSDTDTRWCAITFNSMGVHNVMARAYIQGGNTRDYTGKITIVGKNLVPVITPASATLNEGEMATFVASEQGDTTVAFQWYHNDVLMPGKTSSAFGIAAVSLADSGFYKCRVMDKFGDSAFANPVHLTVTPKTIVKTNTRPLLVVTGRKSYVTGEACTLWVSVTEPDSGQSDSVTILKAPAGYSFSNNVFVYKPPTSFTGSDSVMFMALDNGVPPMADTQAIVFTVSTTIPLPDSIKGLKAISRNNGVFVFSWNKSQNTDSYKIYRGQDTSSFTLYKTIPDTFLSNTIKDTAFYYYVVAANTQGVSKASPRIVSTSINVAPKWAHDTIKVEMLENSSVTINLADSVVDANGDKITYQMTAGDPLKNSLVFSTWKDTATYSDSGTYTIKIQASDGIAAPSTEVIIVHVTNVNRPPQPQPQNLSTGKNTAFQITLTATDPDGDAITSWVIDTATTHGTAVLSAAQPAVTYTPASGFIGTDYFTFKVTAGGQTSTYSAKVMITVGANNIAPAISQKLSAITKNKGDSLILTVTINATAFPAPWYYWYKAGAQLLDSTQVNVWKRANLALADSGYYYVIVKNAAGQDSSGAKLTMQCAPAISPKLAATATVNAGSSTPISIVVNSDATPAPVFKWYFNGTVIQGDSINSYSKTWAITDTGTYMVLVSNAAGKDSSFTKLSVRTAPAGLSYVKTTLSLWATVAMVPDTAIVTGLVDSFTVLPALPAGISISKTTGAITGTPTVAAASAVYTVTAKNQAGTTTASLTIVVNGPPSGFSYLSNPVTYSRNVAITPNSPIITGVVDSYTVSPALPAGLTLAKTSGVITGTPTATGTGSYTVTAKNQAGTATVSLSITINGGPSSPTITAPVNNATGVPVSTTLSWSQVSSATTYHVQLSTASDFSTTVVDDSSLVTTSNSKAVSGLVNGTQYYWRVNAKNVSGTSGWASGAFTTIRQFTLSITAVNGAVGKSPNQTTFDSGTVVTLSETPAANYHFTGWSGGGLSGTTNPTTITMTTAQSVAASFAINTFTITASSGANGIISPNGAISVNYGVTQGFTITPSTGYKVADVQVDGASVGAVTTYSFPTVIATHTINVTFALKTYQLIVSPGPYGTITAPTSSPVTVNHGASTTITATTTVAGVSFLNWTVSSGFATFADSTKATTTVSLTSGDATVRANFIYPGMNFGGGIIFYVDATGQHGLIAAPVDLPSSNWGCDATTFIGTSPGLGTGRGNTISIVNSCNVDTIAAVRCYNLTTGGFKDWYLPSEEEVDTLYDHKGIVPGMVDGGFYWSSTEYSASSAWSDGAYGSGQGWRPLLKTFPEYVRAIRSF